MSDIGYRMTDVSDQSPESKSPAKIPVRLTSNLCPPSCQRFVQELSKLCEVNGHLPDRGRGSGGAADIAGAPMLGADLIEHPFQEYVDEHPGAHIARLLLAPDHLSLFEARQFRHQRLGRERIELLDAQEIDIVDATALPLLVEIVIHLAGTQDDAPDLVVGDELDLFVGLQLRIVPQQPVERSAWAHFVEPRHRTL